MFELPLTVAADIMGYVGQIVEDLSPILLLAVGVMFAAIVVEIVIGTLRK